MFRHFYYAEGEKKQSERPLDVAIKVNIIVDNRSRDTRQFVRLKIYEHFQWKCALNNVTRKVLYFPFNFMKEKKNIHKSRIKCEWKNEMRLTYYSVEIYTPNSFATNIQPIVSSRNFFHTEHNIFSRKEVQKMLFIHTKGLCAQCALKILIDFFSCGFWWMLMRDCLITCTQVCIHRLNLIHFYLSSPHRPSQVNQSV